MADACNLCGSGQLEPYHEPEGSRRGLTVHLCTNCGLVQSLPREDRARREGARVSAAADWGNVRYGKGFRVSAHLAFLGAKGWMVREPHILDVGANRGAFIDAALAAWPGARITAIEPDARVTATYKDRPGVTLLPCRAEETALASESFDLIYSSHTLEHLKDPQGALADHARVLKRDGVLLIEVPNIALIAGSDMLEEWFIDKHLYHYAPLTLTAALERAGFSQLAQSNPANTEYLTFLVRKASARGATKPLALPEEVSAARRRIELYRHNRAANRAALKIASAALNAAAGRTIVWGAGRLFDALVLYGGLDTRRLAGLIDEALSVHMRERHGVKISTPRDLPQLAPDTILVASRGFSDEIGREAKRLAPAAKIVLIGDLLKDAAVIAA